MRIDIFHCDSKVDLKYNEYIYTALHLLKKVFAYLKFNAKKFKNFQ